MKAVMISIQPKWCALIANGEKTIEVRKTKPNIETPFKCYIYCTVSGATKNCSENEKGRKNLLIDYCRDSILDDRQVITQDLKGRRQLGKHTTQAFNYGTVLNGKVIGEFVCDKIEEHSRLYVCEMQEQKEFNLLENSCLSINDINNYLKFKNRFYGWHITELKIYDKPKELGAFNHLNKCPSTRQDEYDGTWYCEEVDGENAVVDKTKQFPYDEECIYFDCPSCGGENYENEEYAFCMCNGYKPFARPPQSWCYCEELEENKNGKSN